MTKNYDLYDILSINSNASIDEIKVAYRRLARKYHPDLNPSKEAEERIKLINIAHGILSDPIKKQQYDFMRKYGVHSNVYSANYGDTIEFTNLSEFFNFLSNVESEELEKLLDSLFNQLFTNFIKELWEIGERFRKTIRKTTRNIFDVFTLGIFRRRSG